MEYYPEEFEHRIGHCFKDRDLLIQALTHSSCAYEMGDATRSNERLEYLGDAVLDFIAGEAIFRRFPELNEGAMTEMRAAAVCEKALAEFAAEIGLGDYLMLGHGEEQAHGERRPSILSDAFEALIAAIYLDAGIEAATNFVLPFLSRKLVEDRSALISDYKTMLQEIVQKNRGEQLSYELISESGPAHDRRFEMAVLLNSNRIGSGAGKTKKEAAQAAAREALRLMGVL